MKELRDKQTDEARKEANQKAKIRMKKSEKNTQMMRKKQ